VNPVFHHPHELLDALKQAAAATSLYAGKAARVLRRGGLVRRPAREARDERDRAHAARPNGAACGFDIGHYAELLEAAKAGGYRFAAFGEEPSAGDLFLRHDVDLSLDAALRMAELEAAAGVSATYFLMTDSVFYNLASKEGTAAVARLRELGHRIGLHAVYPNLALDERFERVVAWHNPDPAFMAAPIPGAINVMEERYFHPETYRSDSNQRWRSVCPHEGLRARAFPWLQLLVHPEIWVHSGSTMGQTMRSLLDAERNRRLRQLRDSDVDLA
jgi:hypothetical protein